MVSNPYPVLLALLLVVLATTASFLHLGSPSNAPKAIRNLATSWLSREILAIGLFSISLAAALLQAWRTGEAAYPAYLLACCTVTGLLLLWTMARVYRIPTIPAWDSGHTPLGFTLTALCLGTMTCLLFDKSGAVGPDSRVFRFLAGFLVVVLVLELAAAILQRRRLLKTDTGINGPTFDSGKWRGLFLVRMALLLLSLLAMLLLISRTGSFSGSLVLYWLCTVMVLLLVQAVAGRVMFYASYFRIGV